MHTAISKIVCILDFVKYQIEFTLYKKREESNALFPPLCITTIKSALYCRLQSVLL